MTTETAINSLTIGSFVITMYKRDGEYRSYPNHPYIVELKRMTPKAKYAKSKILWRYVYKTDAEAIEKMFKTHSNIEANDNKRNEYKEAKKKANASVRASDFFEVGDIVVNSWGYEQTNINFYQVVKVLPKSIEVKEISSSIEDGSMYSHGMACNVIADKDSFVIDGESYTLRVYAEGRLSNPKSFFYMKKWDNKPEYKSWYY